MKKYMKTLSAILTLAMVLAILPVSALAEGSYGVSTQYIELRPGETAQVTISADNAAGKVHWNSEGPVSAAGDGWIDSSSADGTQTFTISADSVGEGGTGYVTVSAEDVATFNGEQLTNGYTIEVVVTDNPSQNTASTTVQDNPGQQQAEAPQEEAAEQAPAADNSVLTDGNSNYEELSEEDRMYTTVNGVELYIMRYPRWIDEAGNEVWNDEIVGLDMLSGFDLVTVNYKGVNVDTFQKDDYRVFILMNPETGVCGYYTLNNGVGFEQLSYITANGRQYIVVDFPADFVVPEGYQMVEMNFGTTKVHALKQIVDGVQTTGPVEAFTEPETEAPAEEVPAEAAPAEEIPAEEVPADESLSGPPAAKNASIVVDEHIEVMLKGYETQISPGLDSADPANDIYYIYCLVDGNTQLYSYDAAEGTLQRAAITVYNEIPTEPETVIVYADPVETETTANTVSGPINWNNMPIQYKVLLIALAVAIVLIIVLIILFAVMSKRNKKRNRRKGKVRSAIPPRSASRTAPLNVDDKDFFSYVKTEEDDFDSYRGPRRR